MVKMRNWPTESKATNSSLVEPDRTAGREQSLTTKRETTVRRAAQLIIYFGLLLQCMRLYHVYVVQQKKCRGWDIQRRSEEISKHEMRSAGSLDCYKWSDKCIKNPDICFCGIGVMERTLHKFLSFSLRKASSRIKELQKNHSNTGKHRLELTSKGLQSNLLLKARVTSKLDGVLRASSTSTAYKMVMKSAGRNKMLMGNRYLRLNYSHYNKTTLCVIGKY